MARHPGGGPIHLERGADRAFTSYPSTPARMIARRRSGRALGLPVILMVVALAPAPAGAAGQSCEELAAFQYPDATVTMAESQPGGPYVAPDAWHQVFTDLPPYCRVTATLTPTSDSNINVEVWMPTARYNGRYLGTGNGGYAGGFFYTELADGINKGFATANTDMGTAPSIGVNADVLVGHPEKWKDFGWRSTHLMTLFAKAVIEAFYGAPANPSYFAGCSTGGQQALMEAQRFPTDYDGILAGDAAFNRTHLHTITVWTYGATHRTPASYIPATKFDVINQRVLAQCGGQDGGAPGDPFLTDPRDCRFDPATLECPAGTDGPTCLNPDQVAAMRQYYEGVINPSNGAVINPGYMPGSETSNPASLGLALNESLTEPAFDSLFKWVFGLTWQWQTFDFNRDMDTVDQVLAADLNADSVDLSAFAGRGGKLILYHGWADPLLPSPSSINYFNALVAEQGLGKTQQYARLFMAPGMWHCKDGPGPNSFGGSIQQPTPSFDPQHDLLSALTEWVEAGVAPNMVIATKYTDDDASLGVVMQRPICSYPQIPVYRGGDPTLASSFACKTDEAADFNQAPAPQYGP